MSELVSNKQAYYSLLHTNCSVHRSELLCSQEPEKPTSALCMLPVLHTLLLRWRLVINAVRLLKTNSTVRMRSKLTSRTNSGKFKIISENTKQTMRECKAWFMKSPKFPYCWICNI